MIVVQKYKDIDRYIKRQLIGLTLRKLTSGMLLSLKDNMVDYDVIYYIINNKVLGWALVNLEEKTLMIYVRRSHRRYKIGTEIVKFALSKYGKLLVWRWNKVAREFFNKVFNEDIR